MSANAELKRVEEWAWMRGFSSLYQKESRAWWSTRRWWINGLLWLAVAAGLVSVFVFLLPALSAAAGQTNIVEEAGGLLVLGLKAFFSMASLAISIGVIILCQDLIIGEKQTGLTEVLLTRPVQRKAYVLAKLSASLVAILPLLVALPGAAAYGLISMAVGSPLPLPPFLAGVGILALHSLFYLTLTLMLGVILGSRSAIPGIPLGILLTGFLLSSLLRPLWAVTPWLLPGFAEAIAAGAPVPPGFLWPPLITTGLWCVAFIFAALIKFERAEF